MKSMTGFGRGTATGEDGTRVTVELSAVNSKKQLELRLGLPRELSALEMDIRNAIQKQLQRGTLNVSVNYVLGTRCQSPVNKDYAKIVAEQLAQLASQFGMPAPTMADVLAVPGVLNASASSADSLRPLVMGALETALKELEVMRVREGKALQEELRTRGKLMEQLLETICAREAETVQFYRDKLRERIAKLGIELPVDDDRLAKEIVFYVDKSDITEETVRLKSHLAQYALLMEAENDAGRNLDFLSQEMGREINTLSAKTGDMAISEQALALKIEISKVKEQVMNVE